MNAPIALLIALAGTVLYHLVIRTAPKGLEPFSLLTIVYVSAGLVSLGIAVKYEDVTLQSLSRNLHPSAFGIALSVLMIEAGYLLAYREGAAIGTASLLVNATLAVLLAIIGWVVFRERLSTQAIIGIAITAAGVLTLAFAPVSPAGSTH